MGQRLDIDALQTLCAIEDFGGITRASEYLTLSQSAVSHKIKRLETGLDCSLLTRRPGAPLLTQDGAQLVGFARRILSLHDEALLSLSKRPLAGKIKLGMTEDTTSSDLSRILGRFVRLHPNVSVRTQVRQSLELEESLEIGEIDLAVMQLFTHRLQGSDVHLYDDRLCWVKARDAELDFNQPLPFLAYDAQCFYKQWAMDAVQNAGVSLETVLECASSAGIVSGVQAGLGVALLPGQHVTSEMEVLSERLPSPPGVTFAVRQGRKSRSKPVAALAEEISRASRDIGKSW
ncbi:DNA-binding transcriptional regulator, LysR family [Roseovarius marisflavi]|uniref:DNA-binding transcriptional regulator, LysR family n=1 Tax=Roseovarius marisflavi TaxID=1054996 RepID=A0A1M7DSV6_9RHOB|nr:LysR family transcriptional regulator [Roseovarius marisflavi]SHL82473.1 DNA-binding transcriptional regulator, LysR family [Roseovarius marisflavi]